MAPRRQLRWVRFLLAQRWCCRDRTGDGQALGVKGSHIGTVGCVGVSTSVVRPGDAVLSRAKITLGRAAYYTEVVAKGLDDYLSGAGEAPGVWAGAGAAFEGIAGVVDAVQMQRLFESADPCHPLSGLPLGASYVLRDGVDRVSGWDLTLSAPKSFSTLWAVAGPELRRTLDECHAAAVESTIEFLEEHGAFSRKGHAGRFQVDTQGLVIARFDHRTSRAGDPQRHSHLLVSNRVRCVDGVWRALDSRALHSQLKAAGAIYQAALRAETVTRVAVRWELADSNSQADIEGVPTVLTGRWSTRRNDVVARAAERISESEQVLGRGLTLAERRREFERATIDTRPAKTAIDRDVHDRWTDEAREVGCAPEGWLTDVTGRAVVDQVGLHGLGSMALDELSERRSTWGRPDLVVAVVSLLPPQSAATGSATRLLVDRLVDETLDDRRVVSLTPVDFSTGLPLRRDSWPIDHPHDAARFSTVVTIAREVEVLDFARQPVDDRGAVEPDQVDSTLVEVGLSADQRQAVQRVTSDGAALSCLVGPAGTGKTTTIAAAAQVWRTNGFNIRGLAVSAVAADVLGGALGVRAETVAKLLWENRGPDVGPEYRIRPGEVLIVDEASMVTSDQFARLTRLAQTANAKIVAVGDYRQLGSVDAGGMFQLLANDSKAVELSGAWRFRHQWERSASLALRRRDRTVTDRYTAAGRLHRGESESTVDAMVQRWAALTDSGRTPVMLAQRRDDVAALSLLAREHRIALGHVQRDGVNVDGQQIGVGDQIVTLRNERRLLTDTGDWVRNGDRWTVTATSIDGALVVASEQRGNVLLPGSYVHDNVALGYALTVHKAQGMTVDHSLVLVDDTTSAEALYVGMTRGRDTNEAYIRVEHPDDDHHEIFAAAVGRDTTERAALDYRAESDPRTDQQRHNDLKTKLADITASPGDSQTTTTTASTPPDIDIDDGIGW